jgi:hypothetical protein
MSARKIALSLFAGAALLVAGCGGDGDGDGGTDAGVTYLLESGTYIATQPTNIVDGCNVDPLNASNPVYGANTPYPLTNNSGAISMGNPTGTPSQPSNGSGTLVDNEVTLVRDNDVALASPSTCTFHRYVQHVITVTADNEFTSNYTRTDSNHSAGCTQTATCTTTWTFTMSKQ